MFSRAGFPQAQARPHCPLLWWGSHQAPSSKQGSCFMTLFTAPPPPTYHTITTTSTMLQNFVVFFRIPGWGLLTSHHSLSHHVQCMNQVALPGGITPRKQTRPLPTPGGDTRLKLARFAFEQPLGREVKTRSDGTCDRQRCSNVTVSRSTHTSPASSLPRFYTRLFGIVSSHHKHAFCSQT